ncbi:MAG: hypothetical protein NC043_07810 [Muribaculaceae bacterium]|nr:hypothetical protein [Muribaculaceae bacterium]
MSAPQQFLDLIESYRAPQLAGLGEALCTPPEVSVRTNPLKGAMPAEGFCPVPWCPEGMYLPRRARFTFSPELHQGLYYVQDASSMFLVHVLRSLTAGSGPVRYLDACAAPGGKTTAAISALPEGSVVTANEYVPSRAAVLRENLIKWGYPHISATAGSTERFRAMPEAFDIVAADVPCSGEGMMRKDAEAVAQWSPELVRQCAARQREILDNLWPALKPGGLLIYSTCTFNREENEGILSWLADRYGAEGVEVPGVDPAWGISPGIDTPLPCYRFIPGHVRGEGLFMAVMRKPDGAFGAVTASDRKGRKERRRSAAKPHPEAARILSMLRPEMADGAVITTEGDDVVLHPRTAWEHLALPPALTVATVKGRDIIPSQALAMSTALNPDAFPHAEVDARAAIDYLSCRAIELDGSIPRGIVLFTYGGVPLGFAKNLGRRANNLYPRPWRILTQGEPEAVDFIRRNH